MARLTHKKVNELTGSHVVPAPVTDDDGVVHGSREIAAWAKAHPANATPAA